MSEMHTLVVQPSGRRGQVAHGTILRSAIRSLGVDIESVCAENATCGKCKILIESGTSKQHGIQSGQQSLTRPGAEEAAYLGERTASLANRGWRPDQVRLACQARILGDLVVTVPEESLVNRQVVRKSAVDRPIVIKPSIRKYLVELNPPTLVNPKPDWERLASGIATSMELVRYGEADLPRAGDLILDRSCLQTLSDTLRAANWRVTVSVRGDREVLRIEPGYDDRLFGAAVDIGTTTVALHLCDLATGEIVATESDMNSQIAFGEDVMSRIHYSTSHPDGLEKLHKSIIRTLNQLLTRAARAAGIVTDDILEMVVVGNTTMQHLFLGISPQHLGVAPFVPGIARAPDLRARELRLTMNGAAHVHVLPAIASFIGADTTAVLLTEAPHEQEGNWLIIDIGTNAELVLGNRHKLICASTPTGPAFEGATIEHGMRAARGAIEHLRVDAGTLEAHWKVIGEDEWDQGRPKGLCGSAVVDAVAELLKVGLLDRSGKLLSHGTAGGRVRSSANGLEYVVTASGKSSVGVDLTVTQRDIRQIQLAKGALFVAAESLLSRFGIERPDKILLAGAFGSYMDKANALAIGMLPAIPLEQIFVVGNSAGDGARIALLSTAKRIEAREIANRVSRHELPTDPAFQERFIRAMAFPEPDAQR